jgi:hypothetical protein
LETRVPGPLWRSSGNTPFTATSCQYSMTIRTSSAP